ncbi:MAG TPA: tetratricopeptide repeat-containing protein [Candidatus Dormibacteraeota bacterium]|nr:tetratricopeptide repeat-containing protein [Candidatus Dormibacteraeota bacterium]
MSRSANAPISSWVSPADDHDIGEAEARLASLPTDALPPRAPLPAGSRVPLAPNPLFVGRGDELLQVAAALRGRDTTVVLGQVVAATGLGGLGKTQLAVEFVHRYGRYFAGGVFWLSFARAGEVPLQVAACAAPEFENRSLEERVRLVTAAWQGAVPRLLVFDNCEEEALLEEWRPSSGGCRVLVTSRRAHWSPTLGVTALPLDLLPRPDSIALLRRYRPDLPADDPVLDALGHELGDLPLALHLAGSYLSTYRTEVGLHGYMAELRRSDVVPHASLLGAGLDDAVSPTHHVQGVAQTFSLCLDRLDRDHEVDRIAVGLLARMACMAPGEPVPRELLAKTMEDVDPLLRADGLRRLAAVGLVEEGDGWLRLHRLLVHFARRESLDSGAQRAVDEVLIECGREATLGHLAGSTLTTVAHHLIDVTARHTGDELRRAALCNATGLALQYAGDLHAARPWLERALTTRERLLGTEQVDTATSLNNLAELLMARGDLAGARSYLERAVSIRERVLGAAHPDTGDSLNTLAGLLHTQGDLVAARGLFERVLAIGERVRGPDHPYTATSLNNLARVLRELGELAAARSIYERALVIYERALGPDHPYTANCLSNLGRVLRDLGEVTAARPMIERALAIRERVLGYDHPDTAFSLNHMAMVLDSQGELAQAKLLYERALDIRERVLGPDHLLTAQSLNNLGALLRTLEDAATGRPLLQRALAIRERVLGPDHPDTVANRRALEELTAEVDGATAPG